MPASLHILTGAPGTGKTTLMAELAPWITTVGEPARRVLAELRTAGMSTRQPPNRFVPLILERAIADHAAAGAAEGVVLFDRGVPDCIAYATYLGTDPTEGAAAARTLRYEPTVLLLRPWREIYTTDDERIMTFEMTERFHTEIELAYREAGYSFIDVPQASVAERVAFIETHLEASR